VDTASKLVSKIIMLPDRAVEKAVERRVRARGLQELKNLML
jgi:hypothetical protein